MERVKAALCYAVIGSVVAISIVGCPKGNTGPGGSGTAVAKKEEPADERKRIENDPNMPPMAKQAALKDLERRQALLQK